jgi:hypothetical protein
MYKEDGGEEEEVQEEATHFLVALYAIYQITSLIMNG